jgi:hypothetical protein
MKKILLTLFSLTLVSCGFSENKYSIACKQLGFECKNQIEFDAKVIRGGIEAAVNQFDSELETISTQLNTKISEFSKISFNVDVAQYQPITISVRTKADRILENNEKIEDKKIYANKVVYNAQKNTLVNIWDMNDEIEVRNKSKDAKLKSYLQNCSRIANGLCRVSLTGEITAVKGENNWTGWIDIKTFNGEPITKNDVSGLLRNQVAIEIRKAINSSSKLDFDKSTIRNITQNKLSDMAK